MNLQIFINSQVIDYSENENLPMLFRVAYRDFLKIAETDSIDLDNASSSLPLPATKTNQKIFEGNERAFFNIDIVKNGQSFFSGRCKLSHKSFKRSILISYNLELYGGTADIFERLEGVSIRDLGLGLIGYSAAAVVASWANKTSDNNKAIFCPAVYGNLNGGVEDQFELEDMRPAVYYETILEGIAAYLGVTIQSNLRGSDLWKRSIIFFGVGDLWDNNGSNIEQNIISYGLSSTSTYTFPSSDAVVFKVQVSVPSGGNLANDLVSLKILGAGGFTLTAVYDTTNGTEIVSGEITLSSVGDTIELSGLTAGGTAANIPAGTQLFIKSTSKIVDGSAVKIESCLPDISAKDFLKEMFLQFNLVSFYNSATKTLILDPAFSFKVGASNFEGFYKLGTTPQKLKTDSRGYQKKLIPEFDTLVFSYEENKLIEKFVSKYTTSQSDPVNAAKVNINDGQNLKGFKSIFQNVFNGGSGGITSKELPILLSEDTKTVDGTLVVENPNFTTEPSNGFVTDEIVSMIFESVNYTSMPICRQNNLRTSKDYTLTFSDCEARRGAVSQNNKGLLSLFYNQYFSMISRLEVVKIPVKISDPFHPQTFREVVEINGEFYILIQLNNVSYKTEFCDGVFVKLNYVRNTDDFFTFHNPSGALQILDI